MEVVVIVRADMPETAAGTNVVVRVPLPRSAVSVSTEVSCSACACVRVCVFVCFAIRSESG